MTILDDILRSVRRRLPELRARERAVREAAGRTPAPPSLRDALAASGLQVMAEIKRRSPSAGAIRTDLDPVALAGRYARGGAAALSVLTEPDHFGGSIADLEAVAAAVPLPVLRKDFVVDPVQVWEARAAGAAAVLLITAALGASRLRALLDAAEAAGLDALVEVHDAAELAIAAGAGAGLIGVNNRNLATFVTDLGVAERLATRLPDGAITVAESGIATGEDGRRMAAAGYDAVLVGEALVRTADPAALLAEIAGRSS